MKLDKIEQKIQRIDEDLTLARAKTEEWRSKVSELEKQREAAENLRIVQIVRNTDITPDLLKQILNMRKSETFVSTQTLPNIIKETETERKIDDEETL